ncbi:CpaF family protein [Fusibacter ferrireducens]|uniref:CpaF family protein n=1 Tax=Fusibacter ferrireducens TaxID=2785058 RepID=A0ABR9ZQD5_9FIRM|nr:CpaF family protein [Fusibacter ferrireducens]MBF4691849.1 CpaF family protein [Fusibacter ferrireducens]
MISYEMIKTLKNKILEKIPKVEEPFVSQAIHQEIANLNHLTIEEKMALKATLWDTIFKYDVIQPLLDDDSISEIMINGPENVFVERSGQLEAIDLKFSNHDHLMSLVHKIATEIDRPINTGTPIMDARLKDGSRVNIVIEPVALNGPVVTIRKFKQSFNNPEELIQNKMLSRELADFLKLCIQSKFNIFICGSTGSGKTTLLNCLTHYIPSSERLITVEDAAELQIQNHENLVSLEVKKSNTNQQSITISHLIKNALRMRPDRIIVGEVRGEEVVDMLQAMNTGHDGSLSTGHSNSGMDMLTRLEVIASSHSEINHTLIRRQIISAIDLIIFIERLPSGKRKITEVSEVIKNETDYVLNKIFDFYEPIGPNPIGFKEALVNKHKLRRAVV